MSKGVVRVPTRTKTQSFKGPQMDFKFPSRESLPKFELDEFHLNNHYLLNDSVQSKSDRSQSNLAVDDEATSQILSDYSNPTTTTTNITNSSSNGYYSFANISDNTTNSNSALNLQSYGLTDVSNRNSLENIPEQSEFKMSPKKFSMSEYTASASNNTLSSIPSADNISYHIASSPSTSGSMKEHDSLSQIFTTDISELKSNNSIPSRSHAVTPSMATARKTSKYKYQNQNSPKRVPMSPTIPTKNKTTIVLAPPNANFSTDTLAGAKSKKSHQSVITHVKDSPPPNLTRIPTMQNVSSINSSTSSLVSSNKLRKRKPKDSQNTKKKTTPKPLTHGPTGNSKFNSKTNKKTPKVSSTPHPKSKLKRSGAVRCKEGGLLYYFSCIGIGLKKLLRALGSIFKRKRKTSNDHTKNGKSTVKRGRSLNRNSHKVSLSLKKPTTSHLKRTQNYVTNLQKSISQRSLQPVIPLTQIEEQESFKVLSSSMSVHTEEETEKITESPTSPIHSRVTASIRRTNSSIRRAASTLTSSAPNRHSIDYAYANNNTFSSNQGPTSPDTCCSSIASKTQLVRSNPSNSLNSIVRQPSIVVKNKVIPLSSMPRFSIVEGIAEEQDEDGTRNQHTINEDEENAAVGEEDDDDEYVIDTNIMRHVKTPSSSTAGSFNDNKSSISNETKFMDANEYEESIDDEEIFFPTNAEEEIEEDHIPQDDKMNNNDDNDTIDTFLLNENSDLQNNRLSLASRVTQPLPVANEENEDYNNEAEDEMREEYSSEEEEEEEELDDEEYEEAFRSQYSQFLKNVISNRIKFKFEDGQKMYLSALETIINDYEMESNSAPTLSDLAEEEQPLDPYEDESDYYIVANNGFAIKNKTSSSSRFRSDISVVSQPFPHADRVIINNSSVFSLPSAKSVHRALSLPVGLKA